MKVILVKNVPNVGQMGEIKEVHDGFARNYLIPQGLVRLATAGVIEEIKKTKASKQNKQVKKAKQYQELAKKVNNLKLIIKAKAEENKTLFGAVNAKRIVAELATRNYKVEEKYIKLDNPIKTLGYYDVLLEFGSGVKAKIGVTVVREE